MSNDLLKIIDDMHSEIIDIEVKHKLRVGDCELREMYGTHSMLNTKLAIVLCVSTAFMLRLKASDIIIVQSSLNFQKKPYTMFGIPIYVDGKLKENYKIRER